MERWLNGAAVVTFWGGINTLLAAMLAGFTAAGLDGGAGHAGTLQFVLYAASVALIFLTAVLVWLSRRRRHGLRNPARPAAAIALAGAAALVWLGLSYGKWIAILAVVPLGIAVLLEVSARRS